ncbi:MAG: AraC family transcriptional regulator [Ktedonobacteraceae bacterium]
MRLTYRMQTDGQPQRADVFLSSPQAGILHSSEALGWRGIVVEQRYFPAGEYTYPRSSSHLISLLQGPSLLVEHIHNQQTFTTIRGRGSVQIVSAGTENIWRHDDGVQLLHIFLTPALLQQVAGDHHQQQVELLTHFQPQDRRIEYISSALLTEVLEGGATGRLYVESLATALATHLIHTYSSTSCPPPQKSKQLPAFLFRRITALIEERLAEDLSLAELASEVGLSPSHFSSLFRKTTGLSPHHYLVQRRLERAQHLLTSTNLSIGEIATTVGFYDQSHLVRHMQRIKGVTPTYIREHLS